MAGTDLISREQAIKAVYWDAEAMDAIEQLPSAEHTAHIGDFTQYQIDWLTAHDDLELEPELESWVIRFLKDTAGCYEKEYLTSAERKGKWVHYDIGRFRCSECGKIQSGDRDSDLKFCCNCGSRNEVSEDD